MAHLILSGVGGSTNWLPFMLPLLAILAAIKGRELLRDWLQKRRLANENKVVAHFPSNADTADGQTNTPASEL